MRKSPHFPGFIWKIMNRLNKGMLSHYRPKSKVARRVLVITTLGRKSGLPRSTPLQFEELDGVYYVASARGTQADWFRNLEACPQVEVQIGGERFTTLAEPIRSPAEIADFLELRKERHPYFMGIMMRLEGLPRNYTRQDLEKLAGRLVVVRLNKASI